MRYIIFVIILIGIIGFFEDDQIIHEKQAEMAEKTILIQRLRNEHRDAHDQEWYKINSTNLDQYK